MKEWKKDPILELIVETDPAATVELESEIGHVKMIPFKGTVKGPLFTGIIEPCGVDTQVTNQVDVRHMSARYMLTGTDCAGQPCHIYVDNNAYFTGGDRPRPWHSKPLFMTDSKTLAPILHRNQFIGVGGREEDGFLHIRVFQVEVAE